MLRPRSPLFNIATDAGNAGGGTPGSAPAPAAESPSSIQPPATSIQKPGVIDSAILMFRDKGAMQTEITTLKKTNGDLMAEVATMKGQLTSITAERDNLQAGFTRLENALKQAASEKTTVQTEVTHQLASAGVPETKLPAGGGSATAPLTSAELWQQAERESDPIKKGQLAAQASRLDAKAALN